MRMLEALTWGYYCGIVSPQRCVDHATVCMPLMVMDDQIVPSLKELEYEYTLFKVMTAHEQIKVEGDARVEAREMLIKESQDSRSIGTQLCMDVKAKMNKLV